MSRVIKYPGAYERRDAFNLWHGNVLPLDHKAIDIDMLGYCGRCLAGLYLIEYSTNPEKPTSVLRRHAEDSGVPGYLVLFNQNAKPSGCAVREIWPEPRWLLPTWSELQRLERFFHWIRRRHAEVCERRSA